MAIYNIYNKKYYICIYFICVKYNIIHVYLSKYIKLMLANNYINIFNYLYRVIQFDVVLCLHVTGISEKKKHLRVTINCNCSNSINTKNILNL